MGTEWPFWNLNGLDGADKWSLKKPIELKVLINDACFSSIQKFCLQIETIVIVSLTHWFHPEHGKPT